MKKFIIEIYYTIKINEKKIKTRFCFVCVFVIWNFALQNRSRRSNVLSSDV